MNRHTSILSLLGVLVFMGNAHAQNEHLIGQKVMTIKWDAEARKGNTVVRKLEMARVYVVTKANGQWLWFNNAAGGWVKRADVVPYEQAIDHFNRQVQQDPSARNYRWRAEAWKAKGELEIAIGDINEAIRRAPTQAAYYNSRGNILRAKNEYDKAKADYNEAIRLDPVSAVYYFNRGLALDAKGHLSKAIEDYTEAIRLNQQYAGAYNARGIARARLGKNDLAMADFDNALRVDPTRADAFNSRGYIWASKGLYDRAVADLNEAIRLDPDGGRGLPGLSWLYATCPDSTYRNGEKALELAKKLVTDDGHKDPQWNDNIAAAYAELGQYDKAIEYMEKALTTKVVRQHKPFRERLKLYQSGKPYREPVE